MTSYELRDLEDARRFLLQGLWLQRVMPPAAAGVRAALDWALEVASAGQPLPPVGFVADVGHVAFGQDWEAKSGRQGPAVPGVPPGLMRTYEDHVLGKVYADWTFARAGDALRRYEGRDRSRGLAFLLGQFRGRAGFAGVELSPGVIKSVLDAPAEDALAQGWESLRRDGLASPLPELYEALIASSRRTAEVLGPEDVFELEHRTALAPLGERLALRQVLVAAAGLENALPRQRVRPLAQRREVPTRVLDEDTYPVGGFSSLSTRGTVESLLYSQLAYMEKDDRPDLFDVKYLRDELLYYSRDENQFLRRRRTFLFALYPDLVQTRFKDAALPYQRGVLLLALLLVVVRRLCDWLSTDALRFEFCFVGRDEAHAALAPERDLIRTLLREQILNDTVHITVAATPAKLAELGAARAKRSLCHCLAVSARAQALAAENTAVTRLVVDGPCPALGDEEPQRPETDDPHDGWHLVLHELLRRWV